jgi:putative transposase
LVFGDDGGSMMSMSRYRRIHIGRAFFFTVVTDRRRPILMSDLGRRALREAIAETRRSLPFEVTAIVLLPDHLHAI